MAPTNIAQLAQDAAACFDKVISTQSIDPAIQALKNLKLAYQDSEYKGNPRDFFEAKVLRQLSNQTLDILKYDGQSLFALNFRGRGDKDDLLGIIQKTFIGTVNSLDGDDFYLDDPKYILGILLEK